MTRRVVLDANIYIWAGFGDPAVDPFTLTARDEVLRNASRDLFDAITEARGAVRVAVGGQLIHEVTTPRPRNRQQPTLNREEWAASHPGYRQLVLWFQRGWAEEVVAPVPAWLGSKVKGTHSPLHRPLRKDLHLVATALRTDRRIVTGEKPTRLRGHLTELARHDPQVAMLLVGSLVDHKVPAIERDTLQWVRDGLPHRRQFMLPPRKR